VAVLQVEVDVERSGKDGRRCRCCKVMLVEERRWGEGGPRYPCCKDVVIEGGACE